MFTLNDIINWVLFNACSLSRISRLQSLVPERLPACRNTPNYRSTRDTGADCFNWHSRIWSQRARYL